MNLQSCALAGPGCLRRLTFVFGKCITFLSLKLSRAGYPRFVVRYWIPSNGIIIRSSKWLIIDCAVDTCTRH